MWLKITTFALLPIVAIQGIKVRKNTPRLPEASGERDGVIGSGKPLSLLILGDSAAIITELGNEFTLTWKLQAQTGNTTQQVIQAAKQISDQQYDIVITSTGVNDVTKFTSARSWLKQQKQLFADIQNRFKPKLIIVSGVPPMQHFPALPYPLAWLFGKYAAQMNQVLQQWLMPQDKFKFIKYDIKEFQALNLPMASDGFHPSKEIYAIWGQKVAFLVRETFTYR